MSQYLDFECRFKNGNDILDIEFHKGGKSLVDSPEEVANDLIKFDSDNITYLNFDADSYSYCDNNENRFENKIGSLPDNFCETGEIYEFCYNAYEISIVTNSLNYATEFKKYINKKWKFEFKNI